MLGKILVIDDEPSLRKLLAAFLEADGHSVISAPDGEAGLQICAMDRPDLVLLDVMMPGMDGFEVCRRLKANPETRLVPVVLITGLSDQRLRGIECGADEFLTKPIDRAEMRARVQSLLNLKAYTDELERAESVVFLLAQSIEEKDPNLTNHCQHLREYSDRLGRRIGLPEPQIMALRRAAAVHDIGKIVIPDSILLKPSDLTPGERKAMQAHAVVGERICRPLKSFRLVLPIIRHHHEKMDGSGYPDGIKGEQIPLAARVLAIADVYDALTTARPYKRAQLPDEALGIMQDEVQRGWWDPHIFQEFSQMTAG